MTIATRIPDSIFYLLKNLNTLHYLHYLNSFDDLYYLYRSLGNTTCLKLAMIHSSYLAVAFGSLVATAALIPTKASQVCFTCSVCSRANLIRIFQQPAIAAADVIIPTADLSQVKMVRRFSKDDEVKALEDLALNTFMVTSKEPLEAQEIYSEFALFQKLGECIAKKGADPAPIEGQSLIGNTPLEEVRYSQCNVALSDCAKDAMVEGDKNLIGWPAFDDEEKPVLRTHSLNLCVGTCRRIAALDNRIVFEKAGMTKEQFHALGTIAYCNVKLVKCLETCSTDYTQIMFDWDARNP